MSSAATVALSRVANPASLMASRRVSTMMMTQNSSPAAVMMCLPVSDTVHSANCVCCAAGGRPTLRTYTTMTTFRPAHHHSVGCSCGDCSTSVINPTMAKVALGHPSTCACNGCSGVMSATMSAAGRRSFSTSALTSGTSTFQTHGVHCACGPCKAGSMTSNRTFSSATMATGIREHGVGCACGPCNKASLMAAHSTSCVCDGCKSPMTMASRRSFSSATLMSSNMKHGVDCACGPCKVSSIMTANKHPGNCACGGCNNFTLRRSFTSVTLAANKIHGGNCGCGACKGSSLMAGHPTNCAGCGSCRVMTARSFSSHSAGTSHDAGCSCNGCILEASASHHAANCGCNGCNSL